MEARVGDGTPPENDLPPRVEVVKLPARSDEPVRGLAVWLVHGGRVELRCEGEGRRILGEGVACALLPGASGRLRSDAAGAEILVFRAGAAWLERACALACRALPAQRGGVGFEQSGTDLARRVSHNLRRLAASSGGHACESSLRETAAQLELAAFALDVAGRRDDAPVSARRRSVLRAELHRVVEALRSAPLDDLSLAALATRLGCSERQLSRIFREEMGVAFREWSSSLRIERARRLLAETRGPVIEIAAETGWSSLAHFNAAFRRRVGCTPTAFRRATLDAQ